MDRWLIRLEKRSWSQSLRAIYHPLETREQLDLSTSDGERGQVDTGPSCKEVAEVFGSLVTLRRATAFSLLELPAFFGDAVDGGAVFAH